jgi:transcriptional regulator with XRE-family HTH domain
MRAEARLSQTELAARLTKQGFRAYGSTVAKIERNERDLRAEELAAYADVFGCSIDALLGRRGRPAGDRNFLLRRLAESIDDFARTVRVGLRDVAERATQVGAADLAGTAELLADIDSISAELAERTTDLAALGGYIGTLRGTRVRALKAQGGQDA